MVTDLPAQELVVLPLLHTLIGHLLLVALLPLFDLAHLQIGELVVLDPVHNGALLLLLDLARQERAEVLLLLMVSDLLRVLLLLLFSLHSLELLAFFILDLFLEEVSRRELVRAVLGESLDAKLVLLPASFVLAFQHTVVLLHYCLLLVADVPPCVLSLRGQSLILVHDRPGHGKALLLSRPLLVLKLEALVPLLGEISLGLCSALGLGLSPALLKPQ